MFHFNLLKAFTLWISYVKISWRSLHDLLCIQPSHLQKGTILIFPFLFLSHFSCLITVASISSTILHKSEDSAQTSLCLKRKCFQLSPCKICYKFMMYSPLIYLILIVLFCDFSVFIIEGMLNFDKGIFTIYRDDRVTFVLDSTRYCVYWRSLVKDPCVSQTSPIWSQCIMCWMIYFSTEK